MSSALLKDQLDIHCGGIDHINVHHTNEIAQSEAATGKNFFNYWLHGAFLNIAGGKKMAKSEDNFLTLDNALSKKGINPLAYRFAALQVHYRKPMEYSEEGMLRAQDGLLSLYKQVASLGEEIGKISPEFRNEFISAIDDDLNMPKAMAVVASVLKSKLSPSDKLATILDFDKVLGLNLDLGAAVVSRHELTIDSLPENIRGLALARETARTSKDWSESDRLRNELESLGYAVEDTSAGQKIHSLV